VGMDFQVGDDFNLGLEFITKPGEPLISGLVSLTLLEQWPGRNVTLPLPDCSARSLFGPEVRRKGAGRKRLIIQEMTVLRWRRK
jgi:hypothetical protein